MTGSMELVRACCVVGKHVVHSWPQDAPTFIDPVLS